MKAPLVPIGVAVIAGITAAYWGVKPLWILLIAGIGLLISTWGRFSRVHSHAERGNERFVFDLALVLLFLAFAYFRYWSSVILPPNHVAFLAPETPAKSWVFGQIVSDVGEDFVLELENLSLDAEGRWQKTQGRALVQYGVFKPTLKYADRVLVEGDLSRPPGVRNPGGWSYERYLATRGIHAILSVRQETAIRFLEKGKGNFFAKAAYSLKQFFQERIEKSTSGEARSLVEALLIGERRGIPLELKEAFMFTGTIHILSISGLHVGFIAVAILFLLRFLRFPRRPRFLIAMIFLVFYALASGASPSVLRATTMAEIYLLGKFLGRSSSALNSLFAAMILILVWNPLEILDLGFWLSVSSVLALILIFPIFQKALFPAPSRFDVLTNLFLGSLCILIVITPLVSQYFGIFYPVMLAANFIVVPLSFLLIAGGLAAAVAGDWFGHWLWVDVKTLSSLLAWFVQGMSRIPLGFWEVPQVYWGFIALYYLLLVGILILPFHHSPRRIPKIFIVWLAFLNLLFWSPVFRHSSKLKVTFFDVGHGDSALIEFPKGETLIVDTGNRPFGSSRSHPVVAYLHSRGIRMLDGAILSHADQDHIGAIRSIHQQVRIARVWDSGFQDPGARFYRELFHRQNRYNTLNQGERLSNPSRVELVSLHPALDELALFRHRNDASLVFRLSYGQCSVLFTGDLEGPGVVKILALPTDKVACTLLKVPHHGSLLGSYGQAFFTKIHPEVALISISAKNPWGLPKSLTMSQLKECGSRVLLTSREGAIHLETDGRRYRVNSLKDRRSLWYTWDALRGAS